MIDIEGAAVDVWGGTHFQSTRPQTKKKIETSRLFKNDFTDKPFTTKILCHFCKTGIEDDHYYKCIYHKILYCDMCAKNDYRKTIPFREAKHCLHEGLINTKQWKDCILNKIEVLEEEKEYDKDTKIED